MSKEQRITIENVIMQWVMKFPGIDIEDKENGFAAFCKRSKLRMVKN